MNNYCGEQPKNLDINKILTSGNSLVLLDKNVHQFFTKTGLMPEILNLGQQSGLTYGITAPTLLGEYTTKDTNTTGLLVIGTSTNRISQDGEEEVINYIDSIKSQNVNYGNKLWFATYDNGAIKKCEKRKINNFNHLDILILMIRRGIIDWKKAELEYKKHPTYQKLKYKTLKNYYRENYKEINNKFKNLIGRK